MEPSYILGNTNPEKISYISENGNPEIFFYISGNGTFLYFRRNLQSPKNQNLLHFSKNIFFYYIVVLFILLYISQIATYLSKIFTSFIKKYMHLVPSEYLLYLLISAKNMYKSLISLLSLQPKKYLKSCLPKGSLLDTTISLISKSFIEI